MTHRILILGGTTEARQLAERLAGYAGLDVTVSLAGRVREIVPHPVPLRVGGFGGAAGLAAHLAAERIGLLIDATHPFADRISANAVEAARLAGVPMFALRRPPWVATAGDRWREVDDVAAAVDALGAAPRRVFLALGRQETAAFADAPGHFYLIRSIEPLDGAPFPDAVHVEARGPFRAADERALLAAHRIDTVVARNSGGTAAYAKIAAARSLGIPVVMIRRPALVAAPTAESVEEAVGWALHPGSIGTARGV